MNGWIGALALTMGFICPVVSPSMAQDAPAATFDFCPRPVSPACLEDADTYTKPAALKICDDEMSRFVQATFNYRNCIAIQSENVIRETNRLAEKFRCRAERKRNC